MDLLNGNQYLRPEYLSPLPTTLDAKKSPLALLAQTCSLIGQDPPSTKGLLSSLTCSSSRSSNGCGSDASSENERSASTSSTASPSNNNKESKLDVHNYHQHHSHTHTKKKGSSGHKKSSSLKNTTPPTTNVIQNVENNSCSARTTPTIRSRSNSTSDEGGSKEKALEKKQSPSVSPKERNVSASSPPQQTTKQGAPSSSGSSSSSSKDKLNLSGPFPSLFPSFQLPPTTPLQAASIPPYLHSYARLKAAANSAAENNFPFSHMGMGGSCRDPFCSGCQLGAAGHHLSSLAGKCPPGCISCDHHKALYTGMFPAFPPFPLPPSLASLYTHHQQAAAAASNGTIPYVCNWIGKNSVCMQTFSSSEELLQHLRSHTSLAQEQSVGTLSSVLDRYGPAPASLSISRTYPTPPLSPLSSSARYHPYAKPPSTSASSSYSSSAFPPGFSLGPHPGFSALAAAAAAAAANNPLSPYYPYSIYGQRLGSNGLGHP